MYSRQRDKVKQLRRKSQGKEGRRDARKWRALQTVLRTYLTFSLGEMRSHRRFQSREMTWTALTIKQITVAAMYPPSLGFSRQEHWSGLPFPSPMHENEKWKGSHSVVSDSSRPHGLQLTRLLRPWHFPGKSTGVGYQCLLRIKGMRTAKLFHTLCDVLCFIGLQWAL